MSCLKPINHRGRWPIPVTLFRFRFWVIGLVAGTACCVGAVVASQSDDLAADQISVRELMRMETDQALQRLRAKSDAPDANATAYRTEPPQRGELSAARLIAIYGVGRKLMAEIRVDSRTLLFMRGRPQAVGPGKTHPMRLLGISDRCVDVALGDQRESLCAPVPTAQRN